MQKIRDETIEELSKEIDVDMWTLSEVIYNNDISGLYGDKLKKFSEYFQIKEQVFNNLNRLTKDAERWVLYAIASISFAIVIAIRGSLAYMDYSPGTLETNKVLEGVILSQRDEIKKIREGRDIAIKSLSDRIRTLEMLNNQDSK